MTDAPILLWFRRDLRLTDHPALSEAAGSGRPVIPVVIRDETWDSLGAAPRWRMGLALEHFAGRLEGIGSRLIFRTGKAQEVLEALVDETGAGSVYWSRYYDGPAVQRDKGVKSWAQGSDIEAKSFNAALLFEPWEVETQQGEPYKVYTPFWRAVKDRHVDEPLKTVRELRAPKHWPKSEKMEDWETAAAMRRGAAVVAEHANVGEETAHRRFAQFLEHRVGAYKDARDEVAEDGCSGMSEHLTYGEVSPRTLWHGGMRALHEGEAGAETFLKELVWREFAWHLMFHSPDMAERNWREDWNDFPWRRDNKEAEAWRRGRTGEPFVDAAMREMYVTGRMHNRARMIVASYLTKHLLTDWRVGLRWFEDCLTDWDPASNSLGWQWVAGSGPDAAPYFRVFNPETQAEKFDKDGTYRRRWIAEGQSRPTKTALSYFDAIPKAWKMAPDDRYPDRVVGLKEGRERALEAYSGSK